jgi:hypothetical protein
MKFALALTILALANISQAAQELTCLSQDFSPENFQGQGLKVSLDDHSKLVAIKKMPGSAFGDTGTISNPKVLSKYITGTVYDANFGHGELYGHLVVPDAKKVTYVYYEFSYSEDDESKVVQSFLNCK